MFIIELTLKTTPMTLSVQRKTEEDAKATYQSIVEAMKSGGNQLLELTCDRQTEKKLAIFADSLAAVQMYEKSGASNSVKSVGFA